MAALERALGAPGRWTGRRVALAFSGGLDSTVLLHALCALRERHAFHLVAAHVHHGLQPAADDWLRHCADQAGERGIEFVGLRVQLAPDPAEGLEAAARVARYRALAEVDCEVLLLGHHRDDQAETVLLQLLRGAGPAGLAAMGADILPRAHPWQGSILRPLLDLPRSVLLDWARAEGLQWVEDPSNSDARIDRNFLRAQIGPALEARFPGWRVGLARSAAWAAEAQGLLEALAALDLQAFASASSGRTTGHPAADDPACLPGLVADYCALPEARQRNLLRSLLAQRAVPPPPAARLAEWVRQLAAAADRQPEIAWGDWILRRWGGRLWLEARLDDLSAAHSMQWHGAELLQCEFPDGSWLALARVRADATLELGALPDPDHGQGQDQDQDYGQARGQREDQGRDEGHVSGPVDVGVVARANCLPVPLRADCGALTLRWNCSGQQRLQVRRGGPHRGLRKLFQEAGVPPWRRGRLPLLFAGDTLVAVAGIGTAADWQADADAPGWQLLWHDGALRGGPYGRGQMRLGMV